MFKSAIERFVTKRAVIYLLVLTAIDLLFLKNHWLFLVGLILGTSLSVIRFISYASDFMEAFSSGPKNEEQKQTKAKILWIYAINQLILLLLLYFAYLINHWLFAGVVIGVMIVPFVIITTVLTEILNITKNHFFI